MGTEDSDIPESPSLQVNRIEVIQLEETSSAGSTIEDSKDSGATLVGTLVEKEEKERSGEYILSVIENGLGYTPNVLENEQRRTRGVLVSDAEDEVREREEEKEGDFPPVDRGKKAWSYLVGTFLAEIMIHSLPFSFGVFQNFYNTHPPFAGQKSIASIGPVTTGLSYLCAPVVTQLMIVYPGWRRGMMYIGLGLCVLGCLGASFAKSVAHLIVTQGIMFGLGIGVAYYPILGYLNEWFIKRRGIASGIMFAGDGVAGAVLPIIFEKCLCELGFRWTLRIWACAMTLILTPDMHYLIRSRFPNFKEPTPTSTTTTRQRVNLSLVKTPIFTFISIANLFQGLAYFIPLIYITSYASDLHISTIRSTTLLSILNLSTVFGQLLSGHLSDTLGSSLPFFLSPITSGLSILLIWGFSKSFGPLMVFGLVYGTTAGGYSILYQRFALECAREDSHTQLWIIGFLYFERGIGNVLSGPISSALIGDSHKIGSYAASKYSKLLIFTGIVMCLGSISIIGRFFKRR